MGLHLGVIRIHTLALPLLVRGCLAGDGEILSTSSFPRFVALLLPFTARVTFPSTPAAA